MPIKIRLRITFDASRLAWTAHCKACETTVFQVTREAIARAPRRPSGSSMLLPTFMTAPHECDAEPLCPICQERPQDPATRNPNGTTFNHQNGCINE